MKIVFLLTVAFCFSMTVAAQDGIFEWARSFRSANSSLSSSVCTDPSGNVITVGTYSGTTDFDPGPGTYNLVSNNGSYDAIISKLDENGNLLWARRIGGTDSDVAWATTDSAGNICIIGSFKGTVDFDPGPGVSNQTAAAPGAYYVIKLNANGDFQWAKQIGFPALFQFKHTIVTDPAGNIFAMGTFEGTVDFDPGPGVASATSGSTAMFVSVFDPNGNFLWNWHSEGTGTSNPQALALTANGDICITGTISGIVDFEMGAGTMALSSSGTEPFVARISNIGNPVWVKSYALDLSGGIGTSGGIGHSIAVDDNENIYTCGKFLGPVDFDPGAGQAFLTASSEDIYISKLNSQGNYVWAATFGDTLLDEAWSLCLDDEANVYFTGDFRQTVDFDPGPGTYFLTSLGAGDIYIGKLDTDGDFVFAKSMGNALSTSMEVGFSIWVHNNQSIYTSGTFRGTTDFDPGPGVYNLTTVASPPNTFILKMDNCIESDDTLSVIACGSYVSPSGTQTWTTSGTYTEVFMNAAGCDSSITVQLTIGNGPTYSNINVSACDSLVSPDGNEVWTVSGIYHDTIPNAGACDSIMTINFTIIPPVSFTDIITACNSHTWIDGNTYTFSNDTASYTLIGGAASGCDSIVMLDLTILQSTAATFNETVCGSIYTWPVNGASYSSAGSYHDTLSNSLGCDSIVTLNLTFNNVDVTTVNDGTNITANANPATYQWLDCGNGFTTINGETGNVFTALQSGSYAVEVTQNGCTDTSTCSVLKISEMNEILTSASIAVYPNPTSGSLKLVCTDVTDVLHVRLLSITGQEVFSLDFQQTDVVDLKITAPDGIYILEVSDGESVRTVRVVKNSFE